MSLTCKIRIIVKYCLEMQINPSLTNVCSFLFLGWPDQDLLLCYRSLLHHDLHDQCRLRERGFGDWQWKDILHFHDGYLRWILREFWKHLMLDLVCFSDQISNSSVVKIWFIFQMHFTGFNLLSFLRQLRKNCSNFANSICNGKLATC